MHEKQEMQFQPLGWEDPLEEEMATYFSILAWKSHAWGALVGDSPWGCKESNMTEHTLLYCIVHTLQDTGKFPQERMIWCLMSAVLRLRNPIWSLKVFWGPVVNCRFSAVSRGSNSKVPADVGMWEPSIQEKNQRIKTNSDEHRCKNP